MVLVITCRFALSLTKEKMEQTLNIAFNSEGDGHYDSSSRNEQGDLEVKSDTPSSLILLRERETNNNQSDFIDTILF